MKTLRDNNNNNSSTAPGPSSTLNHRNLVGSIGPSDGNVLRETPGTYSSVNNFPKPTSAMPTGYNPYAALVNNDINQLTTAIQSYLNNPQKFQPAEMINPLVYLQFLNANAIFMQQLAAIQTAHHPNPFQQSTADSGSESIHYAAKARPMSQEEIAEHARLIYQRALQRNQLQQQSELMKHFYESLHSKHQEISTHVPLSMSRSYPMNTNYQDVPSVPNVSHIASAGTFDVLDTMIQSSGSPSSCLSVKERSVETAISSLSLLSADDLKMISNTSSTLDPSAPVFVPRHHSTKCDDDHETASSSSDSDFNDFHYLDQFLDEFYPADRQQDNHLILRKSSLLNSKTDSSIYSGTLGQGDMNDEKSIVSTASQPFKDESHAEQASGNAADKQPSGQYSVYQLLNRYRNPRCHLVLPEWSRLSLILPNVCSMRAHTYKIKRYFAYRRRLCEDQEFSPTVSSESKDLAPVTNSNISIEA